MGHEEGRGSRGSRFHSSGSERGARGERSDRGDHSEPAPAIDYAVFDDGEDDFDDYDDLDAGYERGSAASGRDSFSALADGLIDDLVPPEVDWRHLVRRHPWPALFLAGLGGYLLGRSQGQTLVRAVSALAVARVESEVLGRIEDDSG